MYTLYTQLPTPWVVSKRDGEGGAGRLVSVHMTIEFKFALSTLLPIPVTIVNEVNNISGSNKDILHGVCGAGWLVQEG